VKALRFARAWRWVLAALLVYNAALGAWDAFRGHLPALALVQAVLVGALVWAIRLNRRTIRNLELQTRPCPDYRRIAVLEREIYGEAFEHDGAPSGARHAGRDGMTMTEFGERLEEFADAVGQARHKCSCGHPAPVLHYSEATGETFCGHCEQPRTTQAAAAVAAPRDPLPWFWLPPGTKTAPAGCLCRWEARSDGYLVINSPSYYGRGMFPQQWKCSVPGHDA
jgi:hypothetical protein